MAACCASLHLWAQPQLTAKEMVAISPLVSESVNLPEDARASLGMKLGQMVTQNGFGSYSNQFVLTANVVVIDKQVTAGAPAQFMVDLEVSVYALNVDEKVIFDEISFNVRGVDRAEHKAVIQAINQIKPRSAATQEFMNSCRGKIIDYYNARVPALLTKAQSLATRNEYQEALEVLSVIPESVDQYPMVASQMSAIYIKMINRQADAALTEAKGLIAVRDYDSALAALQGVDPSSDRSKQALAQIAQIKAKLDAEEQRKLEKEMQAYEDARRDHDDKVELEKLRIEAAKKVGVEQAKNDATVATKLNEWFLGKFNRKK